MMTLGSCVYQPISDATATPSSFSAAITSGFISIQSCRQQRGAEELLADGLHQIGVVVADDQADAPQAALDERADEAGPDAPSSWPGLSWSPGTQRSPVRATPTATRAAINPTLSASRASR